ncbi:MAG: MerR family transcriptional regulator [Ruminococcaceae bacterium]|nr:MerR family transcriptional regulator [Oscillospiraceae bacterium]
MSDLEQTTLYTTGEIAKICDVSVRTVQYYDTRGILVPSSLSEGGRRLYSEEDLSKMKIICFLRELDVSLNNIVKLMHEENSAEVVSLILGEQKKMLDSEIREKESKLKKLEELQQNLKKVENYTLSSIGDVAYVMENKKQMKKLHTVLLLSGIPFTVAEWASIILWITMGIWWPFVLYTALVIPYAVWVSRYYFKRVKYICPFCHNTFVPSFWKAFWANHTPTTRKLTCTKCSYTGFCVETYRQENQ